MLDKCSPTEIHHQLRYAPWVIVFSSALLCLVDTVADVFMSAHDLEEWLLCLMHSVILCLFVTKENFKADLS